MLFSLTKTVTRNQVISQVEVVSITDLPGQKIVRAEVTVEVLGPRTLVLWEAEAYDAIGQWEDSDAIARVKEILAVEIK